MSLPPTSVATTTSPARLASMMARGSPSLTDEFRNMSPWANTCRVGHFEKKKKMERKTPPKRERAAAAAAAEREGERACTGGRDPSVNGMEWKSSILPFRRASAGRNRENKKRSALHLCCPSLSSVFGVYCTALPRPLVLPPPRPRKRNTYRCGSPLSLEPDILREFQSLDRVLAAPAVDHIVRRGPVDEQPEPLHAVSVDDQIGRLDRRQHALKSEAFAKIRRVRRDAVRKVRIRGER